MIKRLTIAFAGTYQQFVDWAREHKVVGSRYITSIRDILGIMNADVVTVGTFMSRDDFMPINEEIEFRVNRCGFRVLSSAEYLDENSK